MSVWLCIPSIRPSIEAGPCVRAWLYRGYNVALLRQGEPLGADIEILTDHYLGWAASINLLARKVLAEDSEATWLVGGGDDTFPDTTKRATEIGAECEDHFGGTFGVMQPIGDLKDWPGSRIDNFAGSPWMGREWCERAYGGNGPVSDSYRHTFADEELQCVAQKLGVFWQRPDLTHKHMHPLRKPHPTANDWPDFLKPINTPESWRSHQDLFNSRKARGFPGHEPLVVTVA